MKLKRLLWLLSVHYANQPLAATFFRTLAEAENPDTVVNLDDQPPIGPPNTEG